MGDDRTDRMGTFVCTQLVTTNLVVYSAMRGAETEFSIKLVHRKRGMADLPYVSLNFEGTRRRQLTDSIWNTSFKYGSRFLDWKT